MSEIDNQFIQDKYGIYTEKELKENWINITELEKINTRIIRQIIYNIEALFQRDEQLQQLKQQLQLEKDNVAELNELLISYKEENIELHYKLGKQKGTIEKIKEIAEEYQGYNRSGFADILQIIVEGDNNE